MNATELVEAQLALMQQQKVAHQLQVTYFSTRIVELDYQINLLRNNVLDKLPEETQP